MSGFLEDKEKLRRKLEGNLEEELEEMPKESSLLENARNNKASEGQSPAERNPRAGVNLFSKALDFTSNLRRESIVPVRDIIKDYTLSDTLSKGIDRGALYWITKLREAMRTERCKDDIDLAESVQMIVNFVGRPCGGDGSVDGCKGQVPGAK